MFNKKYAYLVLFSLLICMVAISSVSAAEDAATDNVVSEAIPVDSHEDVIGDENEDTLNEENQEISNDTLASDNDDELSMDDSGKLSSTSPEYSDYNVEFGKYSYSWSWSEGGTVNIDIEPADESYYYDFYFRVFDSNGKQIKSFNIYSFKAEERDYYKEYYYTFTVEPKSETIAPGTYTMKLVNYKDGHEFDSVTLKVINSPKVVVNQSSATYNGKYSVTVYGKDGKVAKNTPVVFYINGVKVKTVNTNSKGVASFTIPSTYLPNKVYTIKATSLGKSASEKVTIKQILTINTVQVKKSAKNLVLTAKLSKVNGKYLQGKKITFKFNGKTYTAKTNSKGVAKYTINSNVLKKLKVGKTVTYQATYLKDTVKKTSKVKK